jgi:hypothetical protein
VAIFRLFYGVLTKEEGAMSVQSLMASATTDGRLSLSWEAFGAPIVFSIQVALDSEFTEGARSFVVPKSARSCALDIGSGQWYYRVGAWIGSDREGAIDWSGIYKPIRLSTTKSAIALSPFPILIPNVSPALNAVVFHTGIYESYYMIFHVVRGNEFKASSIKSYYVKDTGNAQVQVSGLDPQYTYSFQLQMMTGEKGELPTNAVRPLTDVYSIKNKKTGAVVKPTNATEHASYAADRAILQGAVGRKQQNFSSYADYLQFKAARTRTSGS